MLFLFEWSYAPATDLLTKLLAKKLKYFLTNFNWSNDPQPSSDVISLEVTNKGLLRQIQMLLKPSAHTFSKDYTKIQ